MNIPIPEQIELNINGLLEFIEYITETSQEINTCIEKVKIKYPDFDYSIEILRDTSYNGSSELYLYFFIEIRLKN